MSMSTFSDRSVKKSRGRRNHTIMMLLTVLFLVLGLASTNGECGAVMCCGVVMCRIGTVWCSVAVQHLCSVVV